MKVYICLETLVSDVTISSKIREYYNLGYEITIGCTTKYRNKHKIEDILRIVEPIKDLKFTLSFIKPEYDIIIDKKIIDGY